MLLHQVNYGDGGAGIRPLGAQPARGYPGLGAFWIHPSVLVNAEAVASPTLTVTRAPCTLVNGQTVTTVRFQSQTTRGRIVNEYDAATGLMVLDSISAGPSDAQLQLIGTRTLQLPWPLGRAPRWVRPGVRLDFGGIRRTTILGGGSIDEPAEYTFTLTQAGARWSLAGVSFRIGQTAAGQGFAATGQGQLIGAFWLPETALGVQFPAEGALLDTDPATGAQVFGARGEGGVILVQEVLQGARTTSAYDPVFGALLRSTVEKDQALEHRDHRRRPHDGRCGAHRCCRPGAPPRRPAARNGLRRSRRGLPGRRRGAPSAVCRRRVLPASSRLRAHRLNTRGARTSTGFVHGSPSHAAPFTPENFHDASLLVPPPRPRAGRAPLHRLRR